MDISDISDPQQSQEQQDLQQQQQQLQEYLNHQNSMNNINNSFNTTPTAPLNRDPSADLDIDSQLLQQFSCLGTRDHEDLIKELQVIFDHEINKETAKFFLEMSNWNLQTAVCCYLDFRNFQNLPSMKVVQQINSSEYKKLWKLQNDGTEQWPTGCYLTSPSQTKRVEVPSIKPGETCDLVAEISTINFVIMWRLCTPNGWCFGDTIWMIPDSGMDETTSDLSQRMAQLRTSSSTSTMNVENLPQVNVMILLNMYNN